MTDFLTGSGTAPALLESLGGRRPARVPVWFMRQAGRSLPEYRALRHRVGLPMLEVCLTPELAAEATLQPVRRHGVDAAVLFSDIMVPLRLAGVEVEIEPGLGPVLAHPVRSTEDVARLTAHRLGEGTWTDHRGVCRKADDGVTAVARAVALVLAELGTPDQPALGTHPWGPHAPEGGVTWSTSDRERAAAGLTESRGEAGWTPLIGFGGAPFTLAAYVVEGRPSRDHLAARTLMRADPSSWDRLMTWCAELTGDFMALQVRAGASAAQLFDSWAGSLEPGLYQAHVAPYSALALSRVRQAVSGATGRTVPLIHFGTGTARVLAQMRASGADAVGVDDRTSLTWAIDQLGGTCPVQGNLDPALLAAPWAVLSEAVDACVEEGRAAPGHVVNLGHGVPPGTDPDVLTRVVARVHGSRDWGMVAGDGWDGGAGEGTAAGTASVTDAPEAGRSRAREARPGRARHS